MEWGEASFRATFATASAPAGESLAVAETATPPSDEVEIVAPVVGYFQVTSDLFQVGAQVAEGDVLGSVVALGISNEVVAPTDGQLVEIAVEPNEPVEYARRLAVLRRASA